MPEHSLPATIRKQTGKRYAKALRRDGKIPGIFYIHGEDATPLIFETKQVAATIASKPALISLKMDDGSTREAVIREIQRDPITSAITHIDFMGITRGVKITVTVPVHLEGEPVGIKAGGIREHISRELEIECLPKHIPDSLVIDTSELDIGDSLHVRDLSYENIKILTPEDVAIVNVILPKVVVTEEVEEVEEVEEAEEAEEAKAAEEKEDKQKSTDE